MNILFKIYTLWNLFLPHSELLYAAFPLVLVLFSSLIGGLLFIFDRLLARQGLVAARYVSGFAGKVQT